jgi:gamma-glutamylcyclotransferase (GGCT)/AIG2-like uncharacterized protein YtfP
VSKFNLFVYGTLRAGGSAAGLLDGCEWLGRATVHGILYDIDGRFPALVLYGEDSPVHGDVWRCPARFLPSLDRYEGVAEGLFRRVAAEVDTAGGRTPCWLYTAGPALSRKLSFDRRIVSGEWTGAARPAQGRAHPPV